MRIVIKILILTLCAHIVFAFNPQVHTNNSLTNTINYWPYDIVSDSIVTRCRYELSTAHPIFKRVIDTLLSSEHNGRPSINGQYILVKSNALFSSGDTAYLIYDKELSECEFSDIKGVYVHNQKYILISNIPDTTLVKLYFVKTDDSVNIKLRSDFCLRADLSYSIFYSPINTTDSALRLNIFFGSKNIKTCEMSNPKIYAPFHWLFEKNDENN